MRRVRTVVLPVPAPATIRSGPWSCVTASTWAGFSSSRIRCAAGSGRSGTAAEGRGDSGRDTPDLSARYHFGQVNASPPARPSGQASEAQLLSESSHERTPWSAIPPRGAAPSAGAVVAPRPHRFGLRGHCLGRGASGPSREGAHRGGSRRQLEELLVDLPGGGTHVSRKGVEEALRALLHAGVYLTHEELKGRRPVVRGALTLAVDASRLRNRRDVGDLPLRSEEETAEGHPRLRLLVDPAIAPLDGAAVTETFLTAIGGGSDLPAGGFVTVERRARAPPAATRSSIYGGRPHAPPRRPEVDTVAGATRRQDPPPAAGRGATGAGPWLSARRPA